MNKKKSNNQKKIKEYKRITKSGIIVMIFVLFLGSFFIKDHYGNNIYANIGLTKPKHQIVSKEEASKIKILIDAGHGGFDAGATSSFASKTEAELNLTVALKLQEELQELGFQVDQTRTDEKALADTKNGDMKTRQDLIQNSDANIVISIHMNTHSDSSISGPICFFMPGSVNGEKLATLLQDSLNLEVKPKSPKSPQSQNFLVLRSGNVPAVLVECGFMTNKTEAKKLEDESYQKKLVQSISWGIMDYFATKS